MAEKLEVVILRSPKLRGTTASRNIFNEALNPTANSRSATRNGSARAAREAVESLSITVDEVTPEQASRLQEEEGVELVPRMPFVLPASVPARAPSGDPPAMSWGIEAIGASLTPASAGKDIVVAVLDTGIVQDHPAFRGMSIVSQNFTTADPEDTDGHGTHTAGTIFGQDVDGRRIGVARGVKKALIGKVLGPGGGSTDAILKAMRWALSEDANVINMSLGIDFVGFQSQLVASGRSSKQATSIALAGYRSNIRVFDTLSKLLTLEETDVSGAVVVSAAGNESNRPRYTITVSPPAAGQEFISVAAVDRLGNVAEFSNDEVDLAAPGVDIWSAAHKGGLRPDSGTSMAAPHVAGAAVLWCQHLFENDNTRSASVVQRQLFAGVKPIPGQKRRDVGFGLIQVPPIPGS